MSQLDILALSSQKRPGFGSKANMESIAIESIEVSKKWIIFYLLYVVTRTSIVVFSLEPYERKFSYTVLRGGPSGLPISIKFMIGSRSVSRFKRLRMI